MVSLCQVAVAQLAVVAAEGSPKVLYDRDIRPILSDKCYHCHGPDTETRQADLRLDTPTGLTDHVVVPGKPEESELIARVFSEEDDVRMPPPQSKLALTAEQKELLRRWIAEGAVFTEHWAFQPLPAQVPLPTVEDESWPKQTLDRFVLARLESEGLRPTAEAPPWRLLRRVTLDLTGLPPTADDCRAFERDVAAVGLDAALAQAVDRLLADSAFGEHMAVAWLDAARYADSYGYQSDQLNTQWPYRDWVVRAFNQNLPFDQFLTWQLAGDLLPRGRAPSAEVLGARGLPVAKDAERDQVLATAFNRLHRMTNEGGSIAEEWLVENAADRVHTFGTALLGLTLECARCHDHKYDPITMRDYYSLMAFFNSIDEYGLYDHAAKVPAPSLLLPTPEQEAALREAQQNVAAAETALAKTIAKGQPRLDDWLRTVAPSATTDSRATDSPGEAGSSVTTPPLSVREGQSPSNAGRSPNALPRGEDLDAVSNDLVGYFTFDGQLEKLTNEAPAGRGDGSAEQLQSAAGVRGQAIRFDGDHGAVFPELLPIDRWDSFTLDFWLRDSARNPEKTPGTVVVLHRSSGTDSGYNGFDVTLNDGILNIRFYRVWPGNAIGVQALEPIPPNQWQHVTVSYDGSSTAAGLRLFLNGQPAPLRIVRDRIWKKATLLTHGDGHFTLGQRFRDRGFKDGQIDELRVYTRALSTLEIRQLHDGHALAAALASPQAHRDTLSEYYFAAIDQPARHAARQLLEARRHLVELEETIFEVPVMEELPQPRPTYILARGAYDAPKSDDNRVDRDTFAEILIPFPADAPRNRLGLARWLADPRHPLTARVFLNRLWANFFSRPLVTTPENFGRQGDTPTHPELLDWLSRDFINHGWDVKRLCRSIVLSATYRQDSRCEPALRERDPENRLLARGPSYRLSAEQLRDVALAASGLLDRRIGGPPVSPYQPGEDLWRESNSMSPPYRQSVGRDLYRRSLYSVWKRTVPLPNMLAFDAVTREVCTVARTRTNTPLQALVLLNDVQFVEAARALAIAVAQNQPDLEHQIREAFLRLTARLPDDTELPLLLRLFHEQRALFADPTRQDAAQFLKIGQSPPSEAIAPADLAALTVLCQAILNLDATIYKR
jgi:hypothetical protein